MVGQARLLPVGAPQPDSVWSPCPVAPWHWGASSPPQVYQLIFFLEPDTFFNHYFVHNSTKIFGEVLSVPIDPFNRRSLEWGEGKF